MGTSLEVTRINLLLDTFQWMPFCIHYPDGYRDTRSEEGKHSLLDTILLGQHHSK
ncbi:MAG: hypothetical protein R2797_04675 [Gelidibacter sp.]